MWGSGNIETREYDLGGFTAVKASRFKIEIVQSETYSVTVRADDKIIDRLVVRKSGDTLHLHAKPTFWTIGHITLEATIGMPSLTAIELSGAASARIPEFRGIGRLDLEATGAAKIKGRLMAERIDVLVSGEPPEARRLGETCDRRGFRRKQARPQRADGGDRYGGAIWRQPGDDARY